MEQTIKDLKDAFAGESQAFQKYTAYAQKAERDGFPGIAKLFQATAQAERIHAAGHLRALEMIKDTLENLEDAIAGETYEYKEMYPPMLENAEKIDHRAKLMFGFAVEAEEVHAQLYTKALEAVKAGKDLEETEFYLCPVCGYIEFGKAPEHCPICNMPGSKFERYAVE